MRVRALWGATAVGLVVAVPIWLTRDRTAPAASGGIMVVGGDDGRATMPGTPMPAAPPVGGMAAPTAAASTDPRDLYTLVRAERRDADWAIRSEATIRDVLTTIPDLGHGRPLDIRCATTVCEVTGVGPTETSTETLEAVWQEVRSVVARTPLASRGLDAAGATFGSGRSLQAFTLYYRRLPSVAPSS